MLSTRGGRGGTLVKAGAMSPRGSRIVGAGEMKLAHPVQARERLIVALDLERDDARRLVHELRDVVSVVKIGWQLYLAGANDLIDEFVGQGIKVFLDLKFGDISETVKRLVAVAIRRKVSFITVDTSVESVKAAVEARGDSDLRILTVTLLTHLGKAYLRDQLQTEVSVEEFVLNKTRLAQEIGQCDGVIASGREAAAIRRQAGKDFLIVTPAIRPSGSPADDQHRTTTPHEAISAGADYLVVGRPITRAADRREATRRIIDEMQRAFDSRA